MAYAPTLIFAGWLVDRIGVRRALLIGTVITGVCIGAVALAPSYGTMLLLLGASGLGCGFIYPTAVKAIMLWFPASERATAVGVNQSAVNVSGMLGAAIMPALAAGVRLAGRVRVRRRPGLRGLRRRRARSTATRGPGESPGDGRRADAGLGDRPGPARASPATRSADRAALKSGFAAVLRSRDIWMMGLAALFLGMVEFAALAHLVLFLNADWGYSGGGRRRPAGLLPVRRRHRQAAQRPRERPAAPPPAGAGAARHGDARRALLRRARARPARPRRWLLWGVLFLLGFGAVGWGGLMGTLAGETGGHTAAGAAAGVSAAFFNVGIFFGPPLFGYIVDRTGAYAPAWWTMAGVGGRGARAAPVRARGPRRSSARARRA